MIVVLMGVAGSGKTTLGEQLARRLGWTFIDADDHHPPANVAKMASGRPLDDDDRGPWLDRLNELLRGAQNAVLACSALKERYRVRLAAGVRDTRFVFLKGTEALIGARLAARRHRYMPASLLRSQFEALEAPADAIEVDVAADAEACLDQIIRSLDPPEAGGPARPRA